MHRRPIDPIAICIFDENPPSVQRLATRMGDIKGFVRPVVYDFEAGDFSAIGK
jgi:hypothetical protein